MWANLAFRDLGDRTTRQTIGPRVMLVEEAGQVLEAHILGALVPSIQHVVLIGDPQQLRPTINNYGRY